MPTLTGRVTEVKSGDTLHVQFAEGSATVRLHGIDCPEAFQPYGPDDSVPLRG
jgi:endonuclease YncB( thermonuclease family)